MSEQRTGRRLTETGAERIQRLERELGEARAAAATHPELAHTQDLLQQEAAARAEAEQALVDSERRYRLLLESSADVVFVTDSRRFRYVSPSMETILGHAPASLLGQLTMELVHPDDHAIVEEALARAMAKARTATRSKFRVLHADGSYRLVEIVGKNLLDEPTVRGIVVNMQDVTEREATQEELRRSEARLREREDMLDAAQSISRIGSYRRTLATNVHEWTKETYRIFGETPETITPSVDLVASRIHPDDLPAFNAARQRCEQDGIPYALEHRLIHRDGTERWAHTEGALTRDAQGRPLHVTGTVLDITDRKLAEQELARRERRFRVLVESSIDVFCISDHQVLTYVSPAVTCVLGFSAEELVGTDIVDLVHHSERDRAAQRRHEFLAAPSPRAPVREKIRMRHKDGDFRTVEIVARSFFDDPAIAGTAINFHDVTDREQALAELQSNETVLRESRSSLEKAQSIAHIGSWTSDVSGEHNVMDASDELLRIFGIERDAFDGDPYSLRSAFDPTEWKYAEDRVTNAVITGGPFSYEARISRGGDFAFIHVEGLAERTADGTQRVFGTTLDITERVRAEQELRASEARYRRIIETTSEGVWMIDPERRSLFVNARMAAMLGYTAPEMLKLPLSELVDGPTPAEAKEVYARVLQGASEQIDYRLRRKDGTTCWVSMAVSPVVDEHGNHEAVLAMVTDITERRLAEELQHRERRRAEQAELSLRETEERLRQAQKLESLGQLAGGIAHDFNNILSVILGYTSLLKEELSAKDPCLVDIGEIHEAGLRASDLTRQLLAFSRKQVLQPRALDLNAIIARAEKMLRRLLGEDVELLLAQAPGRLTVSADPGQLEQVIINLAVNARDAMPSGGRLTLQTGHCRVTAEEARVMSVEPGEYTTLTVSDSGVGMNESVRARVFEPFFTTKDKGKGTGLGLSTVFGIVKQSAGHVTVESVPGEGTTFRLLLPTIDAAPESLASGPAVEPPHARAGETILLVEDEDQVRVLARNVLRRSGYRVLEASNAGEALLVAEQHEGKIDLLLTDVVMPRMGGHQLATRLAPLRPEMKVLYVSGYTDDTVLRHGVELGHLAFLSKPFTASTLVAKAREVLEAGEPTPGPRGAAQKT